MNPQKNFARTLVTSALPYANGYIHLGHVAGAYLPADIYTRFLRSAGQDVIHVSGSDEHGVAIVISAAAEGVSPRDVVDKYHAANQDAFAALGIAFDIYGRTTWPQHHETVTEFFAAIYDSGHLVQKEEEQFYDSGAEMFLPDRFVEGTCPNCGYESARGDQCDNCSATYNQTELRNPISKLSGTTPELRPTKHLYFRYGDFQKRLEHYVESHAAEWRDHVAQQTRSWLKMGLGERSITRDLDWGIDVPLDGFQGKKFYVWFDAPLGYVTNTRVLTAQQGEPDGWKLWWCDPGTRYVPFIGKDNIVFHTLLFPALLMARNDAGGDCYVLPDNVPACEFLNLEGRKFSKSRNWGIDLRDYLDRFPADPLRYTLAANMPENKDADFTWRELQARNNNELADILGNFVNRTMQFVARYFDGAVPPLVTVADKELEVRALLEEDLRREVASQRSEEDLLSDLEPKYLKYFTRADLVILIELSRAPDRIARLYEAFRFRDAVLETMNVARAANKYFNDAAPWKTRREAPDRCSVSLNICLQVVRSLSILFEPITPNTSETLRAMLGGDDRQERGWWSASRLLVATGHRLGEPSILFAKIENDVIDAEVARLGDNNESAEAIADVPPIMVDLKPEITIDDVTKLDLRVATVLAAERVKKSKKLLKLRVRIGDLERSIVAGVGKRYEPEELVGRQIVVVANLMPAQLMGEESQGMLLAANSPDEEPTLVTLMDGNVRDGFIVR